MTWGTIAVTVLGLGFTGLIAFLAYVAKQEKGRYDYIPPCSTRKRRGVVPED